MKRFTRRKLADYLLIVKGCDNRKCDSCRALLDKVIVALRKHKVKKEEFSAETKE